ncbi:META domain-containing protein [Nocardioides sp. S-58]|uniref:META domain-containing protein n=1 Tax=Nocardioides renjunii TaxID=3095075 RepID=A0ABU5KAP3_9ACTN|nr:META domain-containing protein [Nocardioides sp. S-58]MDZ5662039.1 META domain-containing protein [Nocardioides sp. S-58]
MSRPPNSRASAGALRARAAAVLATAGLLAACGSDGENGAARSPALEPLRSDMALLEAASFVSSSVEGRELVEDTEVQLSFDGDTMAVSGGCNTSFGAYTIEDGVLSWEAGPAATMMACDDDVTAQDAWLAELLTAGVTATTDGADLHLDSEGTTLVLEREPPVPLDTLLGRTWSVVGTVSDGSTSRLPSRVRTPRLVVGQDGLSRLDTGCNVGRTRVTVDRVSVSFAPPTVTRTACREPDRTIEGIVLSVVDGRSDSVYYDGAVLLVIKDGFGLLFQVA